MPGPVLKAEVGQSRAVSGSVGGCPPGEVQAGQDLGRDFNPGPTVKAERAILPAAPLLISPCALCFRLLCFPCPAASGADSAGSQGAAACWSSEVHVTQAGLPGESERGGEIR